MSCIPDVININTPSASSRRQGGGRGAKPFGYTKSLFKKHMQKLKSVFGLHIRGRIACEPILESAQYNPKFMEPTNICKRTNF